MPLLAMIYSQIMHHLPRSSTPEPSSLYSMRHASSARDTALRTGILLPCLSIQSGETPQTRPNPCASEASQYTMFCQDILQSFLAQSSLMSTSSNKLCVIYHAWVLNRGTFEDIISDFRHDVATVISIHSSEINFVSEDARTTEL